MPLAAGDRLGPYEIVSLVGVGGMGEVYRARDTRLDRTVAIKILSTEIDTPTAREQFDREARAISSLNGPNLCALYDVGDQNGRAYLVMEYLTGETLADRLARGRLSIDEVIEFGTQIAGALDGAHRQGVVHRDLKPGNIMLTKSGVKLLDFGLARIGAPQPWGAGSEATRTLTVQAPLLGTCQYMAPELLEGKKPDPRCDIFAFGAVLYEMITGRRAFQGKTQAVTIANILERDPPPLFLAPEGTGSRLRVLEHLVRTCLVKDPDERRQTAHDIVLALRWLAAERFEDESPQGIPPRRGFIGQWWMIAVPLVVALLASLLAFYPRRSAAPRVMKVSVLPPDNAALVGSSLPALSPDGGRVVFAANGEGRIRLWLRDLDSGNARALAGTESAYNPFWSPDGSSVAFFSNGKLKTVRLTGGPAVTVCDVVQARGGTWGADGTILFAPSTGDAIYRVPAEGGTPAPVTVLDTAQGEVSHRWPWFLPDGRHFLYTGRNADPTQTAIYVGDLQAKTRQRVLTASSNGVYSPPGYLLFVRERTLMAAPFDEKRLRTGGDPIPIAEPVDLITGNVQGSFTVSTTGMAAYYSAGGAGPNSQLTWVDRSGKKLSTVGEPGSFVKPAIAPDGSALAVDRIDPQSGTTDVWAFDLVRGTSSRLTFDPRQDGYPVWSPDSSQIVFSSNRDGRYELYRKSIGSADKEETLVVSDYDKFPSDWSADGKFLVYYQSDPKTKLDLWAMPMTGDRKPFALLATPFNEHRARVSRDGRWMAYTSDETSRDEIYVQAFPSLGGKWRVSMDGGSRPVWSHDGKELYFIAADRKLMSARVTKAGDRFETAAPAPLFETRQSPTRFFDISPDDRRFLLIDPLPDPVTPPMTLLVDWAAALGRR
jgi:Tol biopolymer transport system component/predicted Ser/Thr protein kinase